MRKTQGTFRLSQMRAQHRAGQANMYSTMEDHKKENNMIRDERPTVSEPVQQVQKPADIRDRLTEHLKEMKKRFEHEAAIAEIALANSVTIRHEHEALEKLVMQTHGQL